MQRPQVPSPMCPLRTFVWTTPNNHFVWLPIIYAAQKKHGCCGTTLYCSARVRINTTSKRGHNIIRSFFLSIHHFNNTVGSIWNIFYCNDSNKDGIPTTVQVRQRRKLMTTRKINQKKHTCSTFIRYTCIWFSTIHSCTWVYPHCVHSTMTSKSGSSFYIPGNLCTSKDYLCVCVCDVCINVLHTFHTHTFIIMVH